MSSDRPITMTKDELLATCGSTSWVSLMIERAPFETSNHLHVAADEAFDELSEDDWLEAFSHHPQVGDVDALRERFAASGALSEQEQAGLAGADDDLLEQLARGNAVYRDVFGFMFLARAAGRSAQDLLDLQRERIGNDRATELTSAAQQQREITHLRLERHVAASDPLRPLQGEE